MSPSDPHVAAPTPPYVSLRERLWKAGDVVKAIDRWRESLPIDAFSPEDSLRLLRALASLPTVAAPTPETPSPWQPIETVPDGTDFIIAAYQRHGKSEVGEAFSDGRRWIAAVLNDHIEPTHWMPLPDPPLAGAVSHPQPEVNQ